MRLTTILLLASLMHVSAATLGQGITIRRSQASITTLLKEIRKQSGFDVYYDGKIIPEDRRINISIVNASVDDALKTVLNGMPLYYEISNKNITIKKKEVTFPIPGSDNLPVVIDVSGFVRDKNGRALSGATIRIKGSSKAVTAGANGEFLLEDLDENAILIISYLGYAPQEIAVKGIVMPLQISLEIQNSKLREIEVTYNTGYQTISRERSAGAFSKPDLDVINRRTNSMNILQRLDGLIPGLTVNNAPNRVPNSATDPGKNDPLIIRGITSINASRSPLFVVDGMAMEDVSFVNPQDVADITVLKDATAASIWGARASNGVIVITTKKGMAQSAPRVTYNSFVNFRGKPDLDYIPVLNSRQFIQAARETFDPVRYPYSSITNYESVYSTGLAPHEQFLYNQAGWSAAEVDRKLDSLAAIDNTSQIRDLWYRNAILTNHTLSVSGGSARHAYYGSLAYTGDKSNRPGEQNNTYKLNVRQDFTIGKHVNLYVITDLNNTQSSGKRVIDVNNNFYPYQLFQDAAGHPLSIPYMQYLSEPTRLDYEQRSRISLDYNPLEEINYGKTKGNNLLARLNGGVSVKLFDGLRFEGMYSYVRGSLRTTNFDDANSYKVRAEVVQFTVAPTTSSIPEYNLPVTGGNYSVNNTMQRNWTVRNQLTYDKSWNNNQHQLVVLAGQEAQEQFSTTESSKVRGYDEKLQTFARIDYARLASGIFSPVMGNSYGMSVLGDDSFRSSEIESRFTSYFANLGYTYDGKYSLNASWRIDQSNLFGKDKSAQNRPVVSGGLKWQLGQEDFMKPVKWIDQLALRGTYGITGNSLPVGAGASYDILYAGTSTFYAGGTGMTIVTPGNGALSWESTSTLNLGLDVALFGRLTGTFDLYHKKTKDLLGNLSLNPFTGYGNITGNSGELENRGFEFSITHVNMQTASFLWRTTLLGAHNVNKITKLVLEYPINSAGQKLGANFADGYPGFAIFAFDYQGLDHEGKPQIRLANKSITTAYDAVKPEDVIYAGTYQPVWSGGLSNDLRYKGFGLYVNVSYNLGHVMRRDVNNFFNGRITHNTASFNSGNLNAEFARRWRQPGDEAFTNIPPYIADLATSFLTRSVSYYIQGDDNIVSASYIKMRDVTFSYNFPQRMLKAIKCRDLSIRAQVSNVMLWKANKFGIDPEFQNTISGTRTLPVDQHTLSFGIQAGF